MPTEMLHSIKIEESMPDDYAIVRVYMRNKFLPTAVCQPEIQDYAVYLLSTDLPTATSTRGFLSLSRSLFI